MALDRFFVIFFFFRWCPKLYALIVTTKLQFIAFVMNERSVNWIQKSLTAFKNIKLAHMLSFKTSWPFSSKPIMRCTSNTNNVKITIHGSVCWLHSNKRTINFQTTHNKVYMVCTSLSKPYTRYITHDTGIYRFSQI